MKRVDAVVIQVILTEYNDAGIPVDEQMSKPAKVFVGKIAEYLDSVRLEVSKLNPPPD